MRIYNEMLEKEAKIKKTKSNITNGSTSKNGRKSVPIDEESVEVNVGSKSATNGTNDSNKELSDLREENQRLRQIVEKYEADGHIIVNKASDLKQKDKTSVKEIIELLKLNAYLISHLPDSERILADYISNGSQREANSSGQSASIVSSTKSNTKGRTSVSKAFKSPVNSNPISNYFKSVDKSDDGVNSRRSVSPNSDDSDDQPIAKRLFKKLEESKKVDKTDGRQKKTKDDSNQRRMSPRKSLVDTSERRVSPRKAQNRSVSKQPTEDDSSSEREQNEASTSKTTARSRKSTPSELKTTKEDNDKAKKPKRKRRPRVVEPKGFFPCTFNEQLCDAMMNTKAEFDFHMEGHYDAKYICTFCAYTGPTLQVIKRHINKERDAGLEESQAGKKLSEDRRIHYETKIYRCLTCKVCDKMHDRLEKKCKHMTDDPDNCCGFQHDNDYEFKDHLREVHFANKFLMIKDTDERRKKIRAIVNKFVDEQYFENNAKKDILVEKFNSSNRVQQKDVPKEDSSFGSDWD